MLPLPDVLDPLRWTVLAIALALTVVTGVDYVVRALRLRARGRRALPPVTSQPEPAVRPPVTPSAAPPAGPPLES